MKIRRNKEQKNIRKNGENSQCSIWTASKCCVYLIQFQIEPERIENIGRIFNENNNNNNQIVDEFFGFFIFH